MRGKILGNLLASVVALAVALAAAELAVRLVFKDETSLFPRYHTDYRYGEYRLRGIRPNQRFRHTSADGTWTFVTNGRGFRSTAEIPYGKPAGTLRVLSLGDSHTQGYEVRQEATFSAVLEQYLRSRGVQSEVLNAGVSGFSTAEELAFLENEGVRYAPDVVVLAFYANDLVDNLRAGLFRLDGPGRLVAARREYLPGVGVQNVIYSIPGVKWLGENSYFYSMLFNGVWRAFKSRSARAAKRVPTVAAAEPGAGGAADDDTFELAVDSRPRHSAYATALAIALVARMQAFCEERGIRLIVVDIPVRDGPRQFRSSFPPEMLTALTAADVEHVRSESLLDPYRGAVEFHLPHGHHHIGEFTHALIGAELGRRVLAGREGRSPGVRQPRRSMECDARPLGRREPDAACMHAHRAPQTPPTPSVIGAARPYGIP